MRWKPLLIIGAGISFVLVQGAPGLLLAQDKEDLTDQVVARINTSKFSGRYLYEASISAGCAIVLKEINPKCPDQRGETSFNLVDVTARVDEFSSGLLVMSPDRSEVILQRLYFRGSSARDRRFCRAPEGSILQSQDKMYSQKVILYSDDMTLLGALQDGLNDLGELCREGAGG